MFSGGNGSIENPFLIATASDLMNIAVQNSIDPTLHYLQIADIDLMGLEWTPIGNVRIGPPFMGVYDGGRYSIKNMTITQSNSSQNYGLFSYVVNGHLKDMNIVNGYINVSQEDGRAGLLTSYSESNTFIENCHVNGEIIINSYNSMVGGLCQASSQGSVITKCSVEAKLTGYYVAGFILYAGGDINNSYTISHLQDATAGEYVGGVYGFICTSSNITNLQNCYCVPSVTIRRDTNVYVFMRDDLDDPLVPISCYVDLTALKNSVSEWVYQTYGNVDKAYVKGTNGLLYRLIDYQQPDHSAQPVSGGSWSLYWQQVTPSNTPHGSSTDAMYTMGNYIGWDFDEVWVIDEGFDYPRFMEIEVCTCMGLISLEPQVTLK